MFAKPKDKQEIKQVRAAEMKNLLMLKAFHQEALRESEEVLEKVNKHYKERRKSAKLIMQGIAIARDENIEVEFWEKQVNFFQNFYDMSLEEALSVKD